MPEMSLVGFLAHLAQSAAALKHEEHKGLERAALIIEHEARREIGTYQDAAGPFEAWQELADATKADRAAQGYPENEPLLRSGELRDSINHAVGEGEAVVGSDSDIAVWQELGTSKMPPRSFLGGAAFRKAEEVAHTIGAAPVIALVGESAVRRVLRIEGE